LPVEVVPFAYETHVPFFKSIGAEPSLRCKPDGSIFVTDNGNYIYDCRFSVIEHPDKLEQTLRRRAGVVETGLFVGIVSLALIADGNQVKQLK
jgi:ribose 5-phosphate isomerase A